MSALIHAAENRRRHFADAPGRGVRKRRQGDGPSIGDIRLRTNPLSRESCGSNGGGRALTAVRRDHGRRAPGRAADENRQASQPRS